MKLNPLALVLVLFAFATPLHAQGTEPPPAEATVVIDWNGMTLDCLVVLVSNMTGKVILYDPEALKAKPPLRLSRAEKIPESGVYAFFLTVMYANGLALVTKKLETFSWLPAIETVAVIYKACSNGGHLDGSCSACRPTDWKKYHASVPVKSNLCREPK